MVEHPRLIVMPEKQNLRTLLFQQFLCFLLLSKWGVLLLTVVKWFLLLFSPGSMRPAQEIFAMHVSFWWKDGKNCQQDQKKTGITLVNYLFLLHPKTNSSLSLVHPAREGHAGKGLGFTVSITLSLPILSISKSFLKYFLLHGFYLSLPPLPYMQMVIVQAQDGVTG